MDEDKLKEKEYDRAQAMILEKNERVWQLFSFFITINLAYLGTIFYTLIIHINGFQNILAGGTFLNQIAYSIVMFFASFIVLVINIVFASIWLREHYTVKTYFKQLEWIRRSISGWPFRWFFDDEKLPEKDKSPERGNTFKYIVFLFMLFFAIPFMLCLLAFISIIYSKHDPNLIKNTIDLAKSNICINLILPILTALAFSYLTACVAKEFDRGKKPQMLLLLKDILKSCLLIIVLLFIIFVIFQYMRKSFLLLSGVIGYLLFAGIFLYRICNYNGHLRRLEKARIQSIRHEKTEKY